MNSWFIINNCWYFTVDFFYCDIGLANPGHGGGADWTAPNHPLTSAGPVRRLGQLPCHTLGTGGYWRWLEDHRQWGLGHGYKGGVPKQRKVVVIDTEDEKEVLATLSFFYCGLQTQRPNTPCLDHASREWHSCHRIPLHPLVYHHPPAPSSIKSTKEDRSQISSVAWTTLCKIWQNINNDCDKLHCKIS